MCGRLSDTESPKERSGKRVTCVNEFYSMGRALYQFTYRLTVFVVFDFLFGYFLIFVLALFI
jgi:hypothetical protein